jgi:uncharacterized protein
MKPFRKNVAIAIDGGGIKGVIVTKALSILENELKLPSKQIFQLSAGTSTGAIVSAGIGCGLDAQEMFDLYVRLGNTIFKKSWRTTFFPLSRYKYPSDPLESALRDVMGTRVMGDFWTADSKFDVVITTFDLVSNQTRFVKPWKAEYATWPVVQAVLASSVVPTFFPIVAGRYVDGGVGAYANPCYVAAYEAKYYLGWDLSETTLISLGTGRDPHHLQPGEADKYYAWNWIAPVLGAFLHTADDQQVHLVGTLFDQLDFRRFQVDLKEPIEMDQPEFIPVMVKYGEELGQKILNDEVDPIPTMKAAPSAMPK